MRKLTKTLFVFYALVLSGAAFSQVNSMPAQPGAGAPASKTDPIIENREERAQAKKAYRQDKTETRQQYRKDRAAAKKKLDDKIKMNGGGRDEDKTIRGGGQ